MLDKINRSFTPAVAFRILTACAGLYIVLFYAWCTLKYYGFAYNDFDLAVHDQILWNLIHGRTYSSLLGVDFLGNHVHFISFFLAPFYYFFPHPLFLLFLQTVFLAAGVFPLYALARFYLEHQISLAIGIIYLLYPGLGYTNLYEFHPTCFVPFFLLSAAYYFFKDRFLLFNLFMVLSLLCQENISLIFMMWGVYALILKKELRWVLWPSIAGLTYFLLCIYVILPAFNKGTFNFFNIYGSMGSSLGQVVQYCCSHPAKVISILFQHNKINFLKHLFVSVSFISLLSPLSLLPVLLIFFQHLLSVRPTEVNLTYHYTAEMIPFIFVAFIFGLKRISSFLVYFKYLGWLLILNAVIVTYYLGPHFNFIKAWERSFSDYSVVQKEYFVDKIPKDIPVLSTFKFLSHLSRHQELYSFHHIYTGFNILFSKPYRLPDNVQYALIDFNDYRTFSGFYKSGLYRNMGLFLKQGPWGNIEVRDNIVLFKKGAIDNYPLFNFIDDRAVVPYPVHLTVDKRIELFGYDLKNMPDSIHLVLYWKLIESEHKDVNLVFQFIDQNGKVIDRQYRPVCFRLWPTQAWQKDQFIEDHQYISVPSLLRRRIKKIKVGFFDFKTGRMLQTNSKDTFGGITIEMVN